MRYLLLTQDFFFGWLAGWFLARSVAGWAEGTTRETRSESRLADSRSLAVKRRTTTTTTTTTNESENTVGLVCGAAAAAAAAAAVAVVTSSSSISFLYGHPRLESVYLGGLLFFFFGHVPSAVHFSLTHSLAHRHRHRHIAIVALQRRSRATETFLV